MTETTIGALARAVTPVFVHLYAALYRACVLEIGE